MIAKLSGVLDSAGQESLILDVGGVGYLVYVSPRTLTRVGQHGDTLSLLIETQIREDAFNLFGFIEKAEQEWFKILTGVQGVGAKAAMSILGVTPPDQLQFAIMAGDTAPLTRADGVGPKLATRIVTELKDKAGKIDLGNAIPAAQARGAAVAASGETVQAENDHLNQDAVSALVNLGYGRSDAYAAVISAAGKSNDSNNLNALIKAALKELAS